MCRKQADGTWHYCPSRQPRTKPSNAAPAVLSRPRVGLDAAQAAAVYSKSWDRVRDDHTRVTETQWQAWCVEQASTAQDEADRQEFLRWGQSLPEDPRQARACLDLADADGRARRALARQTDAVAGLRGVPADDARQRIDAYRDQYLTSLAGLPDESRPVPPAEWVEGFTRKDRMASSVPRDPATQYAFYRSQADPDAFPETSGRTWASVDLETAGPPGKEGMEPAHGCIIEVGIVTYSDDGQERDRYSTLVRPAPEAESTYRTGAVAVHGIAWEQVADAPTWGEVAPQVQDHLGGSSLLAQNDRFERGWLGEHMRRAGADFNPSVPGVDTLRVAQQHFSSLPNHRLATICEHVGVPYTNGHRADHDAEVAGRAFFAMRRRIHDTWRDSPLAAVPQPGRIAAPKEAA